MDKFEIEVKFYLNNPSHFERSLIQSNASLEQSRIHEYNLRFDTPDHTLREQKKVLRLRKDKAVHLTYKDPALSPDSDERNPIVSTRREVEFEVSDFESAKQFLFALGYTSVTIYEKYRTSYRFQNSVITIDELPIGTFAEIESTSPLEVKMIADQLGLVWENHSNDSYMGLFERIIIKKNLDIKDLIFKNFSGVTILPEDFDMFPGDLTLH